MTDIDDEIERYNQFADGINHAELEKRIIGDVSDLTYTQTFTAVLFEGQQIEAGAEIGIDGRVESVTVYRAERGQRLDPTPVEPESGVWRAMEIWWEQMRTTWSDDS